VQFPRATRLNVWRREHPEPDQPQSAVERARVKELEAENRRLRVENEFLKRAAAFSRGSAGSRAVRGDRRGEGDLPDRLDVRAARRAPVLVLCVAEPGRDRVSAPRRRELAARVRRVFAAGRGAYGCRRVARVPRRRAGAGRVVPDQLR
jgi:hypothetical protein